MGKTFKNNIPTIFFLSLILLVCSTLIGMPRLSIPIGVGYVLYLIVNPAVPAFVKLGIKRSYAVLLVFCSLIFFSTYPIVKIFPTITNEVENFQYYIPKVDSYLKKQYYELKTTIRDKFGYELKDDIVFDGLEVAKTGTTNILLTLPKIVASILEWIFLVPLVIFFLLRDGDHLKRMLLKITPNNIFERTYYLGHQFNKQLGDYIFAKFVEASIVGIIITSGLLIIDVRFSLLLGLIAGVTNIIPYVGPILGAVPAIVFALAEYGAGTTFGAIFLLYLIANAIDIGIVFPILVSKIVNLHPVLVVISVILGSQYLGVVGMIISIPLAAALKLVFIEIYNEVYQNR